jgi:hypothetical protein
MINKALLKARLTELRAVQAGWAFGVPEDGRDQWLDMVADAVSEAEAEADCG